MNRSAQRGASWVAPGEGADIIAAAQDRRLPAEAPATGEIDSTSIAGALELKRRIIAYWATQGREVECRIERGPFGWPVVRSNVVERAR